MIAKKGEADASHLYLKRINDLANLEYEPRPYAGDVTLFRPSASFSDQRRSDFGWRDLVIGELETVTLPVYPRGMLSEPFVRRLAEELERRVDRACSGASERDTRPP